MKSDRIRSLFCFAAALACAGALRAEPAPGDYFREHTYLRRFSEIDPASRRTGAQERQMLANAMAERVLEVTSLGEPVKAEVSVAYWGGHIGTTGQRFRINGGPWFDIPQPRNTPRRPECYYRTILGRATVEVPLEQIKPGRNVFQFTAGPQSCYGFDWGFYWVYSFTLRLYYKPPAEPPGRILSPAGGGVIGERPRIVAEARHQEKPIVQVDFIGKYEDFNWEGDGVYRQWHYITERGQLARHLGTVTAPPYAVTWDTTWVPDQREPVEIAARITDLDGMVYVTPSVKAAFRRHGRSVKMYKASSVPENFGVRTGRRLECTLQVDNSLANARAARLLLHTWSAAHADEIGLNGARLAGPVGLVHNYSFDALPVPLRLLRAGANTFHIFAKTEHHAAEVNWPGPALLVEYGPPAATPAEAASWVEPRLTHRIPVTVRAEAYERIDRPVEIEIDFGRGAAAGSLRVVEIGAASEVVDAAVPFQFDAAAPVAGKGTLTLLMKGPTPAGGARRYHVYFGGAPALSKTPPLVRLTGEIEYEGQQSFRIETPVATYTFHKEGAGFAGIKDPEGNEWIGYRPGHGSAGEYRGIPNAGEFAHPGYTGETGSLSRIVAQGPLKLSIHSERHDGKRAAVWDIFPSHARMTMLKTDKPYWFLYEGTPGGRLDLERGFQVTSDGRHRKLGEAWSGDLPGPEWIYFGDPGAKQVLYLVNHADDNAPDQYWPMEGNMTVFGFGREYRCCGQYLEAAPAQFTIGFADNGGFDAISRAIESAWRDLGVEVGAVQRRPPGD